MYVSPQPYPYLPSGRTIRYAPEDNVFITAAEGLRRPLLDAYPEATVTAAVIVQKEQVVGRGTNKPMHDSFCPRTAFQMPTGEGYDLCPHFCHPDNHAEAQAIADAEKRGEIVAGADLYLTGHWWLCRPCWTKISNAGLNRVYLVEGATEKFHSHISTKGEPTRSIVVNFSGHYPDPQLPDILKRVGVRLTNNEPADFTFAPSSDLPLQAFVMRLRDELRRAGAYNG